ncbi:uncharacterized protein LOC110417153 [Herrania umbratica]|uniref:Uncharacterized protein LOC110417153 n=1 Tax=Herrania umbratica TaxID=108875 RepID=A0A6J1ADP9_9ROSI|nr:uncharacterized protein LOC110417153 [Herrania umbratica]
MRCETPLCFRRIEATVLSGAMLSLHCIQSGLLFSKPPGRLATRKDESPPSYFVFVDWGAQLIHAAVDMTTSDIVSPDCHWLFDHDGAVNHDGHARPLVLIQVTGGWCIHRVLCEPPSGISSADCQSYLERKEEMHKSHAHRCLRGGSQRGMVH